MFNPVVWAFPCANLDVLLVFRYAQSENKKENILAWLNWGYQSSKWYIVIFFTLTQKLKGLKRNLCLCYLSYYNPDVSDMLFKSQIKNTNIRTHSLLIVHLPLLLSYNYVTMSWTGLGLYKQWEFPIQFTYRHFYRRNSAGTSASYSCNLLPPKLSTLNCCRYKLYH